MEDAAMQEDDKFAQMGIDQLLSAYAIAYKADDVATFTEYRGEIIKRMNVLKDVQYKLGSIKL